MTESEWRDLLTRERERLAPVLHAINELVDALQQEQLRWPAPMKPFLVPPKETKC